MSEPRWAQRIPDHDEGWQRAAIEGEIHVEEPGTAPVPARHRRRFSRRRLLRTAVVSAFALAGLVAIGLGLVIVLGAEGKLSEGLDVRTRNGWVLMVGGIVLLIVAAFLPMVLPRRRRSHHQAAGSPYLAA